MALKRGAQDDDDEEDEVVMDDENASEENNQKSGDSKSETKEEKKKRKKEKKKKKKDKKSDDDSDDDGKKKKKKKKAKLANPTDPQGKIHYLLQTQCRPFGLQQIVETCQVDKGAATIMLGTLEKQNVVKKKVIGNQAVYWSAEMDVENDDMNSLREKLTAYDTETRSLTSEADKLFKATKDLASEPLNANLDGVLEELRQKETDLRTSIDNVTGTVTRPQMQKAKKHHNDMLKTWVNRKSASRDIIDTLADNMEKKPKDILNLFADDWETDEMANVTLPPPKPMPVDKAPKKPRPRK